MNEGVPPSLDRLHDIVLPPEVSWWPTPEAWMVIACVAVWVLAGLMVVWRAHRRNAYRRAALRQVDQLRPLLRSSQTRYRACQQLAETLKRTALAAFPRDRVASLNGDAWLEFLANTSGERDFLGPSGKVLTLATLDRRVAEGIEGRAFDDTVELARRWIAHHRAEPRGQAPKPSSPQALGRGPGEG